MEWNQLADVMALCEESGLEFFRYSINGQVVEFCKDKSMLKGMMQIQTETLSEINSNGITSDEEVHNAGVQTGPEGSGIWVTAGQIGIIHFEDLLKCKNKIMPVSKGETICTIEAMKLFNNVEAPVTGLIVDILINDGAEVEYGQPLFRIEERNHEKL